MNRTIRELAASFAAVESVEALALAGSMSAGLADEWSDYDLYAYTRDTVPVTLQDRLLADEGCTPPYRSQDDQWRAAS
jgi:hypothetical protein